MKKLFSLLKRLWQDEGHATPTVYPKTVTTYQPEPTYRLEKAMDGEWLITETSGTLTRPIAAYTRKRDAVRGAGRRGILLANV